MKRKESPQPLSKRAKFISIITGFSGLFLLSLCLILNLSNGLGLSTILILLICFCFCLVLVLKPCWSKIQTFIKNHQQLVKISFIVVCILGIVLRTIPLLANFQFAEDNNLSDTSVHYYGAQELSENGYLNDNIADYEKYFPYLFPYTATLSLFYSLFHNILVAIIISNLIFDTISCIILYLILKRLQSRPKIGLLFWILNPFFIIMCWLPLNIICVNTILVCALYAIIALNQLLTKKHTKSPKLILLSLLCGTILFLGNIFRPIFLIFLIAEIITLLFINRKNYHQIWRPITAIAIMLCSFFTLSFVYNNIANSIAGEDIMSNNSGWSFFIGSNYETHGEWNRPDSNDAFSQEFLSENPSINAWHSSLFQQGLNRYRQIGLTGLPIHLVNKLEVLFSSQGTSAHDLRYTFSFSQDSQKYILITNLISIYFFILIATCFVFFVQKLKHHFSFSKEELFLALCLLGLTAGFLLVEVMDRYISVILVPMIIISVITLSKGTNNHQSDKIVSHQ